MVSMLLVLGLVFGVIAGFLATVAVGIGWLLTVCFPSIQLGYGVIAGAILVATACRIYGNFLNAFAPFPYSEADRSEDGPILVFSNEIFSRPPRRTKRKTKE